jgi:hypothetical protein
MKSFSEVFFYYLGLGRELSDNELGALWLSFSKCFSIGFYRSPAKPLIK